MNLSTPEQANIDRAHSRASARSGNGSTMSKNQPLIKKNIQLHDLKPADVLIERFVAWKAIVQQLTAYFEGIADIEINTAKELTKLAGVIQVPFRAGNQFLGEKGLQSVFYGIRDKTRIIADQHADLGRTVDSSIVQHLQKLRAEIKAHIKNVQNDTGKLAGSVAKEREVSTRLVGELANDISAFKNTPTNIAPKNDPYVANQAVARQLQRQVLEENLLQKSIVMMQQNSAHFEEGIVQSIQSAWQTFDEWQSHASVASQEIFASLSAKLASLAPDREWIQFAARSDHLLHPDTPLRDPELISYPLKDDPSVVPVHVGHMERKKRFTRAYSECYFVLTPAGFLHEFSTADPNVPGGLVPSFSLFLPTCTLGPTSPPGSKNHKFHIEGRKDGLGTTKSKSGSIKGLLGRGDGGKAWSFRLKSREDMMEWWNDIKMLCARYLVASEQVERTGPVEAAVRSIGYGSEEEGSSDEEEVDAEIYGNADDHAPPGYTIPEKQSLKIGPNGYALEQKPIPSHYPVNGDYHTLHALDGATMDPTSDGAPRQSRRLSRRQMEKAPEGMVEDYQAQRQQEQQQHTLNHNLPPPVPYGGGNTNGNKKGIIPSHVGGRHVSPPPPRHDTENDVEEVVTGDDHDNDEDEDEDEDRDEDANDIYVDDGNRDVTQSGPEPETGTIPALGTGTVDELDSQRLEGDHLDGYEDGVIGETQQMEDISGDTNIPKSLADDAVVHGGEEGHVTQ